MAKTNKNARKDMRNLTREERAERARAKQEALKREQERRDRESLMKKVFTIVVCVILILALGIPTMALTVLSQG